MMQADNTDPSSPLVPKAHNTECRNLKIGGFFCTHASALMG